MLMKKYEFTGDEKEYKQTTFRQIRALVDIPLHGVKAGDLGGWLEEERNLSHEGLSWVNQDSYVLRSAKVRENAHVCGESIIDFRSSIYGNAFVQNSVVHGINTIGENAVVKDSDIRGHCSVHGNTRIESSELSGLFVKGDAYISNSNCFTNLGRLTLETGCIIKDSELHLLDAEPYLARNTELLGVEANQVQEFRINEKDMTLKNESYTKGRRIRIGVSTG